MKTKHLQISGDYSPYRVEEITLLTPIEVKRMNADTQYKFIKNMDYTCKIHKEQIEKIIENNDFKFYRQLIACTDKSILCLVPITERYGYEKVNNYMVELLDKTERKKGTYGGIR